MKKFQYITTTVSIVFSIALLWTHNLWADCAVASGGDAQIAVTQTQGIQFGKMVVPDSGNNATVTLGADGVRSIPSNININNTNRTQHGDTYQVATLNITGIADCQFRVNVTSVPSPLSNITLQGVGGTSLGSNQSGAIGTLSSTGSATVHVGAAVTLDGSTSALSTNIPITVEFVP